MDLLTIRPFLIFIVFFSVFAWWTNRDRISLSVIASVLLGLASLVFLVFVLPPMGFFLLFGVSAGCLLAMILALIADWPDPQGRGDRDRETEFTGRDIDARTADRTSCSFHTHRRLSSSVKSWSSAMSSMRRKASL
jgi:hypothetical protein